MRHRWKLSKRSSKKKFRKSFRPVKMNRSRPGLKRGGTRL